MLAFVTEISDNILQLAVQYVEVHQWMGTIVRWVVVDERGWRLRVECRIKILGYSLPTLRWYDLVSQFEVAVVVDGGGEEGKGGG